jgi:hypothetical protein
MANVERFYSPDEAPAEICTISEAIIHGSFSPGASGTVPVGDIEIAARYFADHPARAVYTSFDGDQIDTLNSVRMQVYEDGAVPVDPEAILGYKDCFDALRTKRRILHADLTLLAHCDEQWIITDYPPVEQSAAELAEGAVAELVFFLRGHQRQQRIPFVSLDRTLNEKTIDPSSAIELDYERLLALLPDDMDGAKEFADYVPTEFPMVYIGDAPAVSKDPIMRHARLRNLRRQAYACGAIGVVSSMATPMRDVRNNWSRLLAARTTHMRFCSELWMPAPENGREFSPLARFYEAVWTCITSDRSAAEPQVARPN